MIRSLRSSGRLLRRVLSGGETSPRLRCSISLCFCWIFICNLPVLACWQTELPTATVYGSYLQGHVIKAGKSLVHAQVFLRDKSMHKSVDTDTDVDGRFVISNLAAGSYRLLIAKWGTANIDVRPADAQVGNRILRLVNYADGCLSIESDR